MGHWHCTWLQFSIVINVIVFTRFCDSVHLYLTTCIWSSGLLACIHPIQLSSVYMLAYRYVCSCCCHGQGQVWRKLQVYNIAMWITYLSTRSLGPTSSWRPLDFVLRALWALRPCDPRKRNQKLQKFPKIGLNWPKVAWVNQKWQKLANSGQKWPKVAKIC